MAGRPSIRTALGKRPASARRCRRAIPKRKQRRQRSRSSVGRSWSDNNHLTHAGDARGVGHRQVIA